ncbi:short chain dehydrogenase [Canariomyces notabilis]|uniref:Short chain dehydrogenase n=1 Tax=Canariomyces notabilis TaxID=2074819 RepID=A0AAN6TNV5_9PEZI|nr:short chain dehydrogenase [Canariomyces arenarius]
MSSANKLTVLITGCSPGGMGAALAVAFHSAGHDVYATARNTSKLNPLAKQGIKTLLLDITSASSIASAVASITTSLPSTKGLDILINNAAGIHTMPLADASIPAARELFDLNVWAQLAVTQAFLPLLLRSATPTSTFHPLIVNHTSVGSVAALPFQGIYNVSKAALAMLTATLRMELAPFDIRVIDLKTAGVKTNIISNSNFNDGTRADRLPEDSIYAPARELVEHSMSQEALRDRGVTPEQWAGEVVGLLLGRNPPAVIWRGESALLARVATAVPCGLMEGVTAKLMGLDKVEEVIREARR